jgi:hypothetical protein
MASLLEAATWALMAVAKSARKLQGLCPVVLKRCRVADEERAEAEMNLGEMQSAGVRKRRAPEQTPGRVDDQGDSPAASPTTSTTSGTMTPGTSEGNLESPGMGGEQESPKFKSANTGTSRYKILSSNQLGSGFLIGLEKDYPLERVLKSGNNLTMSEAMTSSYKRSVSCPSNVPI